MKNVTTAYMCLHYRCFLRINYKHKVSVDLFCSQTSLSILFSGMLGPNMFVDGTNSPSSRSRSLSVERTKANSVVMKKNSKVKFQMSDLGTIKNITAC